MTGFRMTGFTKFLEAKRNVNDKSTLKAITAVEQLLFDMETWGEARANKMSEFLEMIGLDIPDEDVEFQEVCEFVHFVLDHYGEYEGVEEFAEQVSEELA